MTLIGQVCPYTCHFPTECGKVVPVSAINLVFMQFGFGIIFAKILKISDCIQVFLSVVTLYLLQIWGIPCVILRTKVYVQHWDKGDVFCPNFKAKIRDKITQNWDELKVENVAFSTAATVFISCSNQQSGSNKTEIYQKENFGHWCLTLRWASLHLSIKSSHEVCTQTIWFKEQPFAEKKVGWEIQNRVMVIFWTFNILCQTLELGFYWAHKLDILQQFDLDTKFIVSFSSFSSFSCFGKCLETRKRPNPLSNNHFCSQPQSV